MHDTTLSHRPSDENGPGHTLVRVSDPKRTQGQVATLLSILTQCERLLASHVETGCTLEINQKAEEAAAETYALVQSQLRNIVDDQSRWQLNVSEGDRYVERLAEAQLSVVEDQKHTLGVMRCPHRVLSAKIKQVDNGWVAYIGDEPAADGLYGFGRSPIEAFYAFDEAFRTRVPARPEQAAAKKTARTSRKKK